jgi:hypothetical protein
LKTKLSSGANICTQERPNGQLHDLYFSSSIVRVIKSKRLRWARHVTHMGATRNSYKIMVGKPHEK